MPAFYAEEILPISDVNVSSAAPSVHVAKFGLLAFGDLHVNTLAMTVTLGQNAPHNYREILRLLFYVSLNLESAKC